jgi:hypothetical protein
VPAAGPSLTAEESGRLGGVLCPNAKRKCSHKMGHYDLFIVVAWGKNELGQGCFRQYFMGSMDYY